MPCLELAGNMATLSTMPVAVAQIAIFSSDPATSANIRDEHSWPASDRLPLRVWYPEQATRKLQSGPQKYF